MASSKLSYYYLPENTKIQDFSLPYSCINYILEHPDLIPHRLLYKLYQSCKYFFPKFRIIPCFGIKWDYGLHSMSTVAYTRDGSPGGYKTIQISLSQIPTLNFKLYPWSQLNAHSSQTPSNYISTWIPKLYKVEVEVLTLYNQNLTLEEFKFLVPKVQQLDLYETTITDSKGQIVPFEGLAQFTLNISTFMFSCKVPDQITDRTAQSLADLPFTRKFTAIMFDNLPLKFNAKGYLNFIKKYSIPEKGYMIVNFHPEVPEEYRQAFKTTVEVAVVELKPIALIVQ